MQPLVDLYLGVFDWKVQRFCWRKGASLEFAESIYVKITETARVCEELCRLLKPEEEDGQIVSLGIERVRRRMLTVRVVVLQYSQLHKKTYNLVVCEFGGFENVLRDVGIRAIYQRYDIAECVYTHTHTIPCFVWPPNEWVFDGI